MVHCGQRGSEMICGEWSHTFLFEQGGPAQVQHTVIILTNLGKVSYIMLHKSMPNSVHDMKC